LEKVRKDFFFEKKKQKTFANGFAVTTFSEIIHKITPSGEVTVPEDWLQGRTTYGGLSAALCLAGALRAIPDLPPLRAAQFTFIGPAAGALRIVSTVLRRGKNSVFITSDLESETGIATRGTLTFGTPRNSSLRFRALPAPPIPAPVDCTDFFGGRSGPRFAAQFEILRAGGHAPLSGAPAPELLVWIRHRDPAARAGLLGLIALADAMPPAAFSMFAAPAQISTMTWGIDMIDVASTVDGWHLMSSRGDNIADGYSSQEMTLWNESGAPLLTARQVVALFL
jgi:acyl-CoA thioesterase